MDSATKTMNVETRLAALESSVLRLAAENRRYRYLLRGAALLGAAVFLAAPIGATQSPAEVRAKKFVLVDDAGVTRGVLGITADGGTDLTLLDKQGKARLVTGVDVSNVPFFALRNAASTSASVSIAAIGPGHPVLRLADATGRPRLTTSVAVDDVILSLAGVKNRHGAVLAVEGDTPRLSLVDSTGTDRLWVAIRSESPVIQFMNTKGVPRSGFTTVNDDEGVGVVTQSPGAAKPGLVLYGKDMRLLWAGPDK